jgi:hypothetical protein
VAQGAYYTSVKVYIAPVGGGYPSDSLRSDVATYIQARSLVGTTVEVHPLYSPPNPSAEWLYQEINLAITVHVLAQHGQLTVMNAVNDALTKLFAFEAMDFGMFISQGDVYHALLAVQGVDYIVINTMQLLQQNGTTPIAPTVGDLQVGPTLIPHLDMDAPPNGNLVLTPVGGLT